jgi:hypothetical protein
MMLKEISNTGAVYYFAPLLVSIVILSVTSHQSIVNSAAALVYSRLSSKEEIAWEASEQFYRVGIALVISKQRATHTYHHKQYHSTLSQLFH